MKFNQRGQTLVEALVALGISVTIIAAITTIVITSLNGTGFSKNQNLATSLAQQTMENIRRQTQSSYINFVNTHTAQTYCVRNGNLEDSNSEVSANCNGVTTGIYVQQVDLNHNPSNPDCPNSLLTTVTVKWSDSKCTNHSDPYCHKVSLSTCFVDIGSVPSPI